MKLDDEKRNQIYKAFKKTGKIRTTARECNVSRNTVRALIKSEKKKSKSNCRPSKLDPYKAKIKLLVEEKDLSAIRILDDIKDLGYKGGYSILKKHVATIRPCSKKRGASPPIDHAPGHEAQMDWSPHTVFVGGRKIIVNTGSIVLCYSRWLYINFFMDQTIESVLELHEQAFKKLNGIPETITYDNMTTVGKHVGPGEIWINPKFKAFAKKYGFKVIILPPGKKDRHGLVERPFHYIENNCLKGREFLDFEHLRSHGQLWLDNKANVRVHGSLRERPVDRLEKERHFLEKHPDNKFEMYKEINNRLIHRDFCVIVDTNRYSVHPDLVGKKANIRIYKERLEIWVDNKQEAIHVLLEGKYGKAVLVEHDAAYRGTNYQSVLLKKAILRLGEPAESYFTGLKRERGKAAGYHLQRILKMADRYGSDVVSGALSHAMRHGVYNADAIERIISGKNIKKKKDKSLMVDDIPENVRQWLKSCSVENEKLSKYDELVNNSMEDK